MMKAFVFGCALAAGTFVGCTSAPKAPDVTDAIRTSLDQNGFKDVSAKQDREKGVVTLDGHVSSDADKMRAESIAKSVAGNQVVANQIGVLPPGVESDAKKVNSAVDDGIEKNLEAAMISAGFKKDDVKYDVKNGVVTLKGDVNSQARRAEVARVASSVPYVGQVVNELQIKDQKATSNN